MKEVNEKLVSWLFETKAIRVCPNDNPFWYTSGTIGPYYINTHFLYGNEQKAGELLNIINEEKSNVFTCPEKILNLTLENYKKDNIYKNLIDLMINTIKKNINLDEVDYISGGERRDWFFSLIIAKLLNKPHITIYKNLSIVTSDGIGNLNDKKVLHIADLVTEASSYERVWIPAIENKGAKIKWSLVVVDRMQGGGQLLESKGIKLYSIINVDKKLFIKALEMKLINQVQYNMLLDYMNNPKKAMKMFIEEHPEFLENALNADEKTKQRAQLCIEKGFYS